MRPLVRGIRNGIAPSIILWAFAVWIYRNVSHQGLTLLCVATLAWMLWWSGETLSDLDRMRFPKRYQDVPFKVALAMLIAMSAAFVLGICILLVIIRLV